MKTSIPEIRQCFDQILEPKLKWNINTLNLLKEVKIIGDKLVIDVSLVTTDSMQIEQFERQVLSILQQQTPYTNIDLRIGRVNVADRGIDKINNIILVGAGKGGVGKSSIAANLALALLNCNAKVGLLDADLYGPSIPTLLNINTTPSVGEQETLLPIDSMGIKTMSLGNMIADDVAIDWRGQMVSGTILQLLKNTLWGELDYLIIDLPPGTGDILLTITHLVRCNGIILVATPHQLSFDDVKRTVSFCRSRNIPIIGAIENMSYITCNKCLATNATFREGTSSSFFQNENISLLDKLPMDIQFATSHGQGRSFLEDNPDHEITRKFNKLATMLHNLMSQNAICEASIQQAEPC